MKKKKKNMMSQVMAWLALFAIVIWIVGTWILVIFSSWQDSWYGHGWSYGDENTPQLTQEELQRIIEQSSVNVSSVEVEATGSWAGQ